MALDKAEIWVQVHNLPFGFMAEKIGNLMGNHIGRLVKYDFENSCGKRRKFMSIRVEINVHETLIQSWVFQCEGAKVVTTVLKYERMGNFCYKCGIIGHTHNYCSKKFGGVPEKMEKKWGPTLRAEFNSNTGCLEDNQWLRDSRVAGGDGNCGVGGLRGHETIPNPDIIHRLHGKVRISHANYTKLLTFAKHIEA